MYRIILIHPHAAWLSRWSAMLHDMPGFTLSLAVSSAKLAAQRMQDADYDLLIAPHKIISDAGDRLSHYPVWVALGAAAPMGANAEGSDCNRFATLDEGAEFVAVFRLLQTIRSFLQQRLAATTVQSDFIFVKSEYKLIKIQLADILYLSGLRDYTQIFLRGKVSPLTTLQNLKDFESRLPVNNFVRVHRSYIVALAQVETISRNEITIGNTTLPIGHAYRPMLDEMIGKNG